MQVIECWSIQQWDGGDRQNHAFYLTSAEEKEKYMKTHKQDAAVKTTLVVYDTLDEVAENDRKKVRERALAKLTPLEKMALGIRE